MRGARTRIPIWLLEQLRRSGMTQSDILRAYPTLRPTEVTKAGEYVARHRDEIEHDIAENEA